MIIDIDSKIRNLALEKVKRYYIDQSAKVDFSKSFKPGYDLIYVSCIFPENRYKTKYEAENIPYK